MTRMLRLMVFSVFLLSSASWAQLITIDAQKDAYYDNITCPSEGHVVIPPEAFIASNGDMPTSPSDLSAKSWLAWDETFLYYYEERLDDELLVNNATGWQNDVVELKLTPNLCAPVSAVKGATFSVIGELDADVPEGVRNVNTDGDLTNFDAVEGEDYARDILEDNQGNLIGVKLEFRIPWASIVDGNETVDPVAGSQFGLAINITDNDAIARDGMLQWSAGMVDAVWNTPRLLGTAILRENNQIELTPWSSILDTIVNENGNAWYKADPTNCADFQAPTFCDIEPLATPITPASIPAAPENDVISIFSDVYTDISGVNLNPDWGQSTEVVELVLESDTTLLYKGLNYQGIDFDPNHQDLTAAGMEYLHVDIWNVNSTDLGIFLISSGPAEKEYLLVDPANPDPTTERWLSFDIPLSEFSDVVDLSDVFQFKFDGNGNFYLDNLYFSKTKRPAPTRRAYRPSNPESNVISIFSDAYTDISDVNFNPDWGQRTVVSELTLQGDKALVYSDFNYQGIDFDPNHQDVSGMTHLHLSLWNATSDVINIYLISPGPNESVFALPVTPAEEWQSINIPLTAFTASTALPADLTDIFQFKLDGGTGGLFYIDNLVFANEEIVVGIEEVPGAVPSKYTLEQNYPNPFNPETTIRYSLKQADKVTLTVYNTLGQQVARLITNQRQSAGVYEVTWDGRDDNGMQVASGVYLYRISTSNFTSTKKMVMMK